MVARYPIRCSVVAVPVSSDHRLSRGALARDVLPWADPYVAQLIKKLQDEVRHERRMRSRMSHASPLGPVRADANTSWRISAVR
jgi:hypothetical protein